MKLKDAQAWFDEVAGQSIPRKRNEIATRVDGSPILEYLHQDAVRWITGADAALKSVFPAGHAVAKRWDQIFNTPFAKIAGNWSSDDIVDSARAVFESARAQLQAGRLAGLVDGIRAESVDDLLDQAGALLDSNYLAAAAVMAGGALESFLKHLCERHAVGWNGHGSISAYSGALAQARNSGREIISQMDGKLVEGWGGTRNEGAHKPGQFAIGKDDVRRMIDGIRDFVARRT